jgi:hypothetical protein
VFELQPSSAGPNSLCVVAHCLSDGSTDVAFLNFILVGCNFNVLLA